MCLELQTVITVVQPDARGCDPLTSRDHRSMAHGGHQIPVASCFHPQHAKAVLGIVEGHPFHKTREDFRRALGGWLHGTRCPRRQYHGITNCPDQMLRPARRA